MDEVAMLGHGAYGTVYLLKKYSPPIVMKEISLSRFHDKQSVDSEGTLKELLALKELVHENIVRYLDQPFDFTYTNHMFPIFMEYCEEGTLKDAITDVTLDYSVATIVHWSMGMFTALAFLKSNQIAHRDIKAANLFLTRSFVLKIGDFGLIHRFVKEDSSRTVGFAGTLIYMAPELKSGSIDHNQSQLDEEDIYKCDVYAAGLVILELMERRPIYESNPMMMLSKSSCPKVSRLQNLVLQCSSSEINIKSRKDADEALGELKALEPLFSSFIALPERTSAKNRRQKRLKHPDGLCFVEKEEDWSIGDLTPDVGMSMKHNMDLDDENPKEASQKHPEVDSKLKNFIFEWMPKFREESEFKELRIKYEVTEDIFKFNTLVLSKEEKEDFSDSNDIRKQIGELIPSKDKFEAMAIEEKHKFVDELQKFFKYLSKKNSSEDFIKHAHFTFQYMNAYFENDLHLPSDPSIKAALKSFQHLVSFDFHLQEFCIRFALHVLWSCDSLSMSWVESVKLLDVAIHNIEEIEKGFTRRLRFDSLFLKSSKTEWCAGYDLIFRQDLTEIRVYSDNEKGVFKPDVPPQVIDIEVFRRALYAKKDSVIRYAMIGERKTTNLTVPLQSFLDFANQKIRNDQTARTPGFPRDYLEYLPKSVAELAWTDKRSNAKIKDLAQIYFSDSIPLIDACKCSSTCKATWFPDDAPTEEMKIKVYACPNLVDRLAYLKAHSVFDRSFRLLHQWTDIELHRYTHSYLLKSLLREIDDLGKRTEIGFCFMMMREKAWPGYQIGEHRSPKLCDHEGGEGNRERTGLLIGLNAPYTNAFWSKEFKFESACHACFLEYVGLVFVSISELYDILMIMDEFLSTSLNGSGFIDRDKSQKRQDAYQDKMREAIEKFWTNK